MKTVKVKTSELSGKALDWAVGQIDRDLSGLKWSYNSSDGLVFAIETTGDMSTTGPVYFLSNGIHTLAVAKACEVYGVKPYSPSTNWSQCGPLIDKYIEAFMVSGDDKVAVSKHGKYCMIGHDFMTSSCRTIVVNKLGDEVEIPEELAS